MLPYNVFDLVRYWYLNGRPIRMEYAWNPPSDLSSSGPYDTVYFQYNWHGDVAARVPMDGAGGATMGTFYEPWGNSIEASPVPWHYYRWNGGWGYLQFSNLGMYYVHGRWYRPDIGRFISPDEGGSYIYAGNNAVNKGWIPLWAPSQDARQYRYIYTKNWGFFDIDHINAGREHAQQIMEYIRDVTKPNPLRLDSGDVGVPEWRELIEVRYDVRRPIPEQQQLPIRAALGIFLDFENRWERFQGRSRAQLGSSYSIEDLPSDYLGFYQYVSGSSTTIILDYILKEKGTYRYKENKPWWADRNIWDLQNRSINPMVCNEFLPIWCATKPWPSEMEIKPIQGPFWQFVSCTGRRIVNVGPIHTDDSTRSCD